MKKSFTLFLFITLTLLTCFRLFWNLDKNPVERWDEETNIQVVDQTRTSGTFPLLILDAKPFYEKPPIFYLAGIGITLLGIPTALALRLLSALSAALLVGLCVGYSYRTWNQIAAVITWVVLLTSYQLYITNIGGYFATHTLRSADVDSLHLLFLFLSFLASSSFHTSHRHLPYIAGICAGLSILTKSPLGLVPLFITTAYHWNKKNLRKAYLQAWISAGVVSIPWYIWMTFQFGSEFLFSLFGYHLGTRAFTAIEGHQQVWQYFLILLSNPFIYPWGLPLVFSILYVFISPRKRIDTRLKILAILVISFVTIPSLMQTRLAWYILPMYPFAALILGGVSSIVWAKLIRKRVV